MITSLIFHALSCDNMYTLSDRDIIFSFMSIFSCVTLSINADNVSHAVVHISLSDIVNDVFSVSSCMPLFMTYCYQV